MSDIEEAGTPTEEAIEIDLDENLGEAYDRIQSGKSLDDLPAVEGKAVPEGDGEPTASGEEKSGEPETEESVPDEGDGSGSDLSNAPESWSAEGKAKFQELPEDIRKEVHRQEENFKNGHAKSAEARELAKDFKETVAPYEAIITSEGGTPMRAFKDLLNMGYVLRRGTAEQKTQLLLNTAKQFGVELGQSNSQTQESDEYVDPAIAELRDRQTKLENQNQYQLNQEQTARTGEATRLITEFKDLKDEGGTLKHPHFEAVKNTMAVLINGGNVGTMEEAYEQAVWANPDARAKILEGQKKEAEKKQLDETKRKAAEAKKTAGTQVSTTGTGDVAPVPRSWDEELSDDYDTVMSA